MAKRTAAQTRALKEEISLLDYKINHLLQNAPRVLLPGGKTALREDMAQQVTAWTEEQKMLSEMLKPARRR